MPEHTRDETPAPGQQPQASCCPLPAGVSPLPATDGLGDVYKRQPAGSGQHDAGGCCPGAGVSSRVCSGMCSSPLPHGRHPEDTRHERSFQEILIWY